MRHLLRRSGATCSRNVFLDLLSLHLGPCHHNLPDCSKFCGRCHWNHCLTNGIIVVCIIVVFVVAQASGHPAVGSEKYAKWKKKCILCMPAELASKYTALQEVPGSASGTLTPTGGGPATWMFSCVSPDQDLNDLLIEVGIKYESHQILIGKNAVVGVHEGGRRNTAGKKQKLEFTANEFYPLYRSLTAGDTKKLLQMLKNQEKTYFDVRKVSCVIFGGWYPWN